jgi:glutathione S-transferase
MLLRTTVNSPFGRKVRVTAEHLGLSDRIERVDADFRNPDDALRRDNPLGKMPVLTTNDGLVLYDSRVIVEYLDSLAGGRLCPATGEGRWAIQQRQALADGVMDAGVAIVLEGVMRPEAYRYIEWESFQRGKIERGIDALAGLAAQPCAVDHGSIAVACMLDWLAFRNLVDWRTRQPRLDDWLKQFNDLVPSFSGSAPQ